MRNSKQVLKEQNLTTNDLLSEGADEKLIYFGWKCQVEIINEMAVNEAQKIGMLRRIKNIKQDKSETMPLWDQ